MTELFANTHRQPLSQHCALVGLMAHQIIIQTYQGDNAKAWAKAAFMAGLLHDIGKIDPAFQSFLSKGQCSGLQMEDGTHILEDKTTKGFSFNDYPRHNEVSWALLEGHIEDFPFKKAFLNGNAALWEHTKYAVYWHHAKPLREDPESFSNFSHIYAKMDWAVSHLESLKHLLGEIFQWVAPLLQPQASAQSFLDECITSVPVDRGLLVPPFKRDYSAATAQSVNTACVKEAINSAVRSAVVLADRMVSSYTPAELQGWLELWAQTRELPDTAVAEAIEPSQSVHQSIRNTLERFQTSYPGSERNTQQSSAAAAMAAQHCTVLQGPAGCGKTKIILEYISKQPLGRRTFIFVPRTAVGQGLFHELVTEYGLADHVEFLSSELKLRAHRGEIVPTAEGDELNGQIVITTVDQLCGIGLSHRKIDLLTEVMRSTVVFDEFHELFDTTAIVLMFMEMMYLRSKTTTAKTALVSATPNQFFLKKIAQVASCTIDEMFGQIVQVPSFNTKPIHIHFEQSQVGPQGEHPFDTVSTPGEIAVANTATRAQISAVRALDRGNAALCFHSKYTAKDKQSVFDAVMRQFGKNSGVEQSTLYAGPIVQASLNITTRQLHTEAIHAENWLQRLGRVNRFGSFEAGTLKVYNLMKSGADAANHKRLLSRLAQYHRTQAWIDYSESAIAKTTTLGEIYALYEQFHRSELTQQAYERDFELIVQQSARVFKDKHFDPVQMPAPKGDGLKKLSANSLRGNSFYILPVYREYSNGRLIEERWLYSEQSSDRERLTDSLQFITNLESDKKEQFLSYMADTDTKVVAWRQGSQTRAGLPNALLKLFKKKRRIKGLHIWQYAARNKETPVVVSFPGQTNSRFDFEQTYLKKNGTLIGLLKGSIK